MDGWIQACPRADLKGKKPLSVQIGEWPVVLFRGDGGMPWALLDRCPHRGVPLSLGSVCRGRIVCCYHGWEFDGDGRCTHIPSNVEPTAPKAMVARFEVKEAAGYVWVRPTPQEP